MVALSRSWVVQATEISEWEVSEFFLKLSFHGNKTFKIGVSLMRKIFDPISTRVFETQTATGRDHFVR